MRYELHHVKNCDALSSPGASSRAARVYLVVRHGDADWKTRPVPELGGCEPRCGRNRLLSEDVLRKIFTDDSESVLRDVADKGYALVRLRADCYLDDVKA